MFLPMRCFDAHSLRQAGTDVAEKTGIAWTTHTWSPWIGCTEVSPGCDHCYARELDKRHRYGGAVHWGAGVPRYRTKQWDQPIKWDKKAAASGERAFVFPSLCDPFDNEVPEEWRSDLFDLIWKTQNLTWLLLTKRIGNVVKITGWNQPASAWPNVWLGASVVNPDEAARDLYKLRDTPAAKRFVSYEPALALIDWTPYLSFIDWLIVGGESAQGGALARPFDLAWARATVAQCKAASVACFVKQLGSNPEPTADETSPLGRAIREGGYRLKDRAGADPAEWPEDLRVQEFPN